MADILTYLELFKFALIGGCITALACSLVGFFTILRKEALIGEGIAHLSLGGVAIGLFLGIYPLYSALFLAIIAMMVLTYIRRKGIAHSDAAIGLIIAFGLSTALILISLADGFNVNLFDYLFGSILTISQTELTLICALAIGVIVFLGVFYKELLSLTFDEEAARLSGVPVDGLTFAFNVMVALTVVLSIKVVGIFLVSALLIIPGLTALQLKKSFSQSLIISGIIAVTSVITGVLFSAIFDVATSGLIIFISILMFIFAVIYSKLGDE